MSSARSRPRRIGSFQVLHEIGQGGMGVVYLADQPSLDRHVVLKKIRRELLGDESAVERFRQEARAAAAVHHQNVVAVYDSFTHRGDHFIAQEWVPGLDLQELLGGEGALAVPTVRWIALEIARGLEEIHARGIVHRDLKPANILIGSRGEIKIADFGIAFTPTQRGLTTPGMMMGSLPYVSPEQLRGERIDTRSDLYNFGLIVWEMLVGATPFGSATDEHEAWQLVERMRSGLPRARDARPDCPRDLDRLLRACLSFSRDERPADAATIRRALERRMAGDAIARARAEVAARLGVDAALGSLAEAIDEAPTAVRELPVPRPSGRRVLWAALAVLLGAVAIDAAGWWRSERPTPPAPRRPAQAVARPAQLEIVVDPRAGVSVDGERLTTGGVRRDIELAAGTHLIAAGHPELGALFEEIELRPGERRTIYLNFPTETVGPQPAWRDALFCGELERARALAAELEEPPRSAALSEIEAATEES